MIYDLQFVTCPELRLTDLLLPLLSQEGQVSSIKKRAFLSSVAKFLTGLQASGGASRHPTNSRGARLESAFP